MENYNNIRKTKSHFGSKWIEKISKAFIGGALLATLAKNSCKLETRNNLNGEIILTQFIVVGIGMAAEVEYSRLLTAAAR